MKSFIRVTAVLTILSLAGCGGSKSGATSTVAYLYAVGQGVNAVLGFTVQSDGQLSGVAVPQFATNPAPVALAVTPNHNLVYVANSTSNTVSGFSVNHQSGVLAPIGNALPPTPVGTNPISVAVDSTGQFLFVLNQGSNIILAFTTDAT